MCGRLAGPTRDPVRLRRYLRAIAANTAGIVTDHTMQVTAEVNRATGLAYDTALETLFVTERLPAYASNRLDRLTKAPKRHFVVAQIRPELPVAALNPHLFHLRNSDGRHEMDLLVERADGSVIAFEIKATAAPGPGDAVHLQWLRARLGDRLVAAVVLHTGPRAFTLLPGILALPICTIWG